jgi:hypothetical protein
MFALVIVFMCAILVPESKEPGTLGAGLLPVKRDFLPTSS